MEHNDNLENEDSSLYTYEYFTRHDKPKEKIEMTVNTKAVKESMNRMEVLDKLRDVLADRGADYGTPRQNHQILADLMNVVEQKHKNAGNWNPEDTMLLMILVKVARLCTTPQHIDSWLDIAGYAACAIDAINEE